VNPKIAAGLAPPAAEVEDERDRGDDRAARQARSGVVADEEGDTDGGGDQEAAREPGGGSVQRVHHEAISPGSGWKRSSTVVPK
jgi:hypothetical protein